MAAAATLLSTAGAAAAMPASVPAPVPAPDDGRAWSGAHAVAGAAQAVAPRSLLEIAPFRLRTGGAAGHPAPGLLSAQPRPKDGSTLLYLEGGFGATWGGGQADLKVDNILNLRASGTSGDLVLSMWATATLPVDGESIHGYETASYDLGTLPAGGDLADVDTGEIPYTPPPPDCFYVSLVLLENGFIADIRTFPSATHGSPQTNGYDLVPLGGESSCPFNTTCTRTATSACLDSGRFQVAATYDNTANGAGTGTVLQFGSARAESDESVFFYFTDPSNFEMGVKVLDACVINNSFWVFIGGLTNQGWTVHVLDTQTGHIFATGNLDGTTTVTTTATAALPCP